MSGPKRRQIMIRGLSPDQVRARLVSYNEELYQGPHAYTFRISEALKDWVHLEVPTDLPLAQFHNLAKWFDGDSDADGADDFVVVSRGEAPWDYWLVPCRDEGADWFLTGATGEGKPFQWDLMSLRTSDDPRLQRAPMGTRVMFMTRKVHGMLHKPDAKPRVWDQITLYLEAPGPQELVLPEPGSLADTFRRTPDPQAGKGGFEQVMEMLGSLFSPNRKGDGERGE